MYHTHAITSAITDNMVNNVELKYNPQSNVDTVADMYIKKEINLALSFINDFICDFKLLTNDVPINIKMLPKVKIIANLVGRKKKESDRNKQIIPKPQNPNVHNILCDHVNSKHVNVPLSSSSNNVSNQFVDCVSGSSSAQIDLNPVING